MKGLKELKALPIVPTVKVTVNKDCRSSEYYRKEKYHAYSARVIQTKNNAEMLEVCVYDGSDAIAKEHGKKLNIAERHFLSESGEFASERYFDKQLVNGSQFVISTSDVEVYESSYLISHLKSEYGCEEYVSLNSSDDVILKFAKKHKLFKTVLNESYREPKPYQKGIYWLAAYQSAKKQEKAEQAKERLEERTRNRMNQIADEPPKDFCGWCFDEKFSEAPWFYYFENRTAKGICGACKKITAMSSVKNNKKGICPACGRTIKFISVRKSFKSFRVQFTATLIERLSEDEFVNRYFDIVKNYDGSSAEGKLMTENRVSFREYKREFWSTAKGSVKNTGLYQAVYPYYGYGRTRLPYWERIPPRRGINNPGMIFPGNAVEITKAVSDRLNFPRLFNMDLRPLFEQNTEHTPTEIFKSVMRMPSIESMAKMGLHRLANGLINNTAVSVIDTGSPAKQLGVDKLVLQKFISSDISLYEYRYWHKWRLGLNDWENFKYLSENHVLESTDGILNNYADVKVKFGTLAAYLKKQSVGKKLTDTVMYWKDYLNMAQISGLDLEHNKDLLYPADVKKEHDRFMMIAEVRKNENEQAALEKRAELLNKLAFEDDDFIIIPLRSVQDFVNESSVLNHCVKTYVKQCAKGSTNIFGLREKEAPETPYFTVNIDNHGRLIQNRGKNNCAPPKEVKVFTNKWLKFVAEQLKKMSLEPGVTIETATASEFRIGA